MARRRTDVEIMADAGKLLYSEHGAPWQSKLAEAINISPILASYLLSGARKIQPAHMSKLAKVVADYRKALRVRAAKVEALARELKDR